MSEVFRVGIDILYIHIICLNKFCSFLNYMPALPEFSDDVQTHQFLGYSTKRNSKGSDQGNNQFSLGPRLAERSSALATSTAQLTLFVVQCEMWRLLVEAKSSHFLKLDRGNDHNLLTQRLDVMVTVIPHPHFRASLMFSIAQNAGHQRLKRFAQIFQPHSKLKGDQERCHVDRNRELLASRYQNNCKLCLIPRDHKH